MGAVLSAAALAVSACGVGGDSGSASESGSGGGGEDIQLGVVDSLTGANALSGAADVCGIKIAIEAVNEAGGVLDGRQFAVTVEDSQSQPAVAAQQASALTDQGIKLFAGQAASAQMLAMLPILNDAGALSTGGVTKAPEVISSGELIVRINSNGTQDAEPTAAYLQEYAKTVVFIGSQGAYGESAVQSVADAMGADVQELKRFIVPAETSDYTSVMTEIAALKPDAVVYAVSGATQAVGLIRDFHAAAIDSQLVAPPGLLTPLVVQATGPDADGAIGSGLYAPSLSTPGAEELNDAWSEYKDDIPECADVAQDDYVALSYGQVKLLADAIEEAGTDDPTEVRDAIIAGEWELPTGTVTFSEDGQIEDPQFNWFRVENGEVVLAPDIEVG